MRARQSVASGDQDSPPAHLVAEDDGGDRGRPPAHRSLVQRQVRRTQRDRRRARSETA